MAHVRRQPRQPWHIYRIRQWQPQLPRAVSRIQVNPVAERIFRSRTAELTAELGVPFAILLLEHLVGKILSMEHGLVAQEEQHVDLCFSWRLSWSVYI